MSSIASSRETAIRCTPAVQPALNAGPAIARNLDDDSLARTARSIHLDTVRQDLPALTCRLGRYLDDVTCLAS
jgi:hypothetical protein